MKNKYLKLCLCIGLLVFVGDMIEVETNDMSFVFASSNNKTNENEKDSSLDWEKPLGEHLPSPNGFKVPGWYFVAGFLTQPMDEYFVPLNNPQKIKGVVGLNNIASSMAGGNTEFIWKYLDETTNGWKTVEPDQNDIHFLAQKDTMDTSVLTVQSDHPTVRYYQLSAQVKPLAVNTIKYSKIAKVTFIEADVDAKKLKAKTDIDYLANGHALNKVTYAQSLPFPKGATGNVTWSIRNESGEGTPLATIDPLTGKIISNSEENEGKVIVTATMMNPISKQPIQGNNQEKPLTIGKLLTLESTPKIGSKVKLKLHFDEDPSHEEVHWYKSVNGVESELVYFNGTDYTTQDVIPEDNNAQVYAKVSKEVDTPDGTKIQEIQSNRVTIKLSGMPKDPFNKYSINQELQVISGTNYSNDGGVFNFKNGRYDLLHLIHIDISPSSPKNNPNAHIKFPLYKNENVKLATIDNRPIDPPFKEVKDNTGEYLDIPIPTNKSFKKTIKVQTYLDSNGMGDNFDYSPTFYGITSYNEPYNKSINSIQAQFYDDSLFDGSFEVKPQKISFGTVFPYTTRLVGREGAVDNQLIAKVIDRRKLGQRESKTIKLKITDGFHIPGQKAISSIVPKFVHSDHSVEPMTSKGITVLKT